MRYYKADLHIHSVLSPCGGLEMSPRAMLQRVKELNIEWIAITDHNSLANCPAYAKVAAKNGIAFTYGVEIQTSEEIHLLAYFDDTKKAMEFDRAMYDALPSIPSDAEFFGDQVVIDAEENIIRIEKRALSNSVIWSLEEAVQTAKSYGGFCIPAHVDAAANSILGQLGFLPLDLDFPVLGITSNLILEEFLKHHPELREHTFLRTSDAHYLSDLGCGSSRIFMHEPCRKELEMAARNLNDRKIII
ncbi:MAG: PHP domain-containing protein [Candidatus Cloacimonadaceae bacterium]